MPLTKAQQNIIKAIRSCFTPISSEYWDLVCYVVTSYKDNISMLGVNSDEPPYGFKEVGCGPYSIFMIYDAKDYNITLNMLQLSPQFTRASSTIFVNPVNEQCKKSIKTFMRSYENDYSTMVKTSSELAVLRRLR